MTVNLQLRQSTCESLILPTHIAADCQCVAGEHCMYSNKMCVMLRSCNVMLGDRPASSPHSSLITGSAVQGFAIGTCPAIGLHGDSLLGFPSPFSAPAACHLGECIDKATVGCSSGQLVRVEKLLEVKAGCCSEHKEVRHEAKQQYIQLVNEADQVLVHMQRRLLTVASSSQQTASKQSQHCRAHHNTAKESAAEHPQQGKAYHSTAQQRAA